MNDECAACRAGEHGDHQSVVDWSVAERKRRPCCCETCTAIPF